MLGSCLGGVDLEKGWCGGDGYWAGGVLCVRL